MTGSSRNAADLLLVGDVGGTKTLLAIVSAEAGPRAPLVSASFASAEYGSLGAMVREFLGRSAHRVTHARFAVAGPVQGGSARITNLPWELSEAQLAVELQLRSIVLLNDLHAIALAVPSLTADELHTLHPGEPVAGGALAVVAPGTGLGMAFLTWDGQGHRAFPSEGGHADFAPVNDLQAGLLAYLRAWFGHVSVERVCSGPGLLAIYEYLRGVKYLPETAEVAAGLAAAPDKPPVIGAAAVRAIPDRLARAAVDMLVEILGAAAGNLALSVLATGGVYLAGGIPARLLPALEAGAFMRGFAAKGRMEPLLQRIPVRVVMARAALLGAALP